MKVTYFRVKSKYLRINRWPLATESWSVHFYSLLTNSFFFHFFLSLSLFPSLFNDECRPVKQPFWSFLLFVHQVLATNSQNYFVIHKFSLTCSLPTHTHIWHRLLWLLCVRKETLRPLKHTNSQLNPLLGSIESICLEPHNWSTLGQPSKSYWAQAHDLGCTGE